MFIANDVFGDGFIIAHFNVRITAISILKNLFYNFSLVSIIIIIIIFIIVIVIIIRSYYCAPQAVLRSASQHKIQIKRSIKYIKMKSQWS